VFWSSTPTGVRSSAPHERGPSQMKIQEAEYDARCESLAENLRGRGLTGAVLFDNAYVLYYTGFAFVPTERPAALVVNASGERGMLVPRLEREHAQSYA